MRVELGSRAYVATVRANLLAELAAELKRRVGASAYALVTDERVLALVGRRLLADLRARGERTTLVLLPRGERAKTLRQVERICEALARHGFDRQGVILALGGGTVGDAAGLAAGLYLRGIRHVPIPTTLLAQVDSALGGKTAANLSAGKNLVGLVQQPAWVACDPLVLGSLSPREWKAGLGEVLKVALLAPKPLLSIIQRGPAALGAADLETIIVCCLRHKAALVAADERDLGERQALNLGHSFAHALETVAGWRSFRHGEAVAWGLGLALDTAVELGLCSPGYRERILSLRRLWGLERGPRELDVQAFLEVLGRDKKGRSGRPRLVLPCGPGRVRRGVEVSPARLKAILLRALDDR